MKKLFFLVYLIGCSLLGYALPADFVWHKPSLNSSESMPVGGGCIGMNVWVENGDLLFYVNRSGHFDENNTLLKVGRFRIQLPHKFQSNASFTQRLVLKDGYMVVDDGSQRVTLWVDVFKPVIHVEVQLEQKGSVTCNFESWRHHDRAIGKGECFQSSYKFRVPKGCMTHQDQFEVKPSELTFYHQNPDSTVFDATAVQQKLNAYIPQMYNPLGRLIFGGKLSAPQFTFQGTYQGVYQQVDYQGWRYTAKQPLRQYSLDIVLADVQGTVAQWKAKVQQTSKSIQAKQDFKNTIKWWNAWWNRSCIEGQGKAEEITRNYTLFRYMLGCNAHGQWPTKFNGGLFTFEPHYVDAKSTYTPDYRRWGGGTHTAQNQRLVYWPMLKSGDYDALKSQLDFYVRILKNAELRSQVYWNHEGAAFTEQIENFGLPEHDEYGLKRPADFDPGMEYNAWLEYTWDTVLEFCQMALEAESYGGMDISAYIPWIKSSLDFFDQHYRYIAKKLGNKQIDQNGKLIIYPGSGGETFKMAYNPSSTVAGLKVVTQSLLSYLQLHHADSTEIKKYQAYLKQWPDISYREVDGHQVIAPAQVWARVNNVEPTMLYPVYPWRLFGVGKDSLDIAINTWKYDPYVKKFKGIVSWEQANIWAADLGLTEDAAYWNTEKMKNGPYRFPAFWGPGHDWTPDHNWGGSGMIGMQEMLLQESGDKIYIFPAWPQDWNVHFKLHGSKQTTVEATLNQGKIVELKVYPKSREKDIIVPPTFQRK